MSIGFSSEVMSGWGQPHEKKNDRIPNSFTEVMSIGFCRLIILLLVCKTLSVYQYLDDY